MHHFTTKLAGIALALGLLAIPLGAGARTTDVLASDYAHHRYFFSEEGVWRTGDEPVAQFAMIEMTKLEQIAGRQYLDRETILFLEENTWDHQEPRATPRGGLDTRKPILDRETILFLEDNIWDFGGTAEFAGFDVEDEVAYPSRCHGEGLADATNRAILGIEEDEIGRYCAGNAYPAGDADVSGNEIPWLDQIEPMDGRDQESKSGVYDIDPDLFSNETPWQDEYDPMGEFAAGGKSGAHDIDIGFFSNEMPWQDVEEPVAGYAETKPIERAELPFDAPQLRAEEPR